MLIQAKITSHLRQKGRNTNKNDHTLLFRHNHHQYNQGSPHINVDGTLSRDDSTLSRLNMKIIKSREDHYDVLYLLKFYINLHLQSFHVSMLTHSPYKRRHIIDFSFSHCNLEIKTRRSQPIWIMYVILLILNVYYCRNISSI